MIAEKDVAVPMRDGVNLSVDIYRPDAERKVSGAAGVLDLQQGSAGAGCRRVAAAAAGMVVAVGRPARGRRHQVLRLARLCARDRLAARRRQVGRRRLAPVGQLRPDRMDRAAAMVRRQCRHGRHLGLRRRAVAVAKQKPPHLKAIFPFDPRGAYGTLGGFREEYPGGVLHFFRYLIDAFRRHARHQGKPGALPPDKRGAVAGGDAQSRLPDVSAHLQRADPEGPAHAAVFRAPDRPLRQARRRSRRRKKSFAKIKVPTYTGSGWYGYTYKTHLNGAQNYFEEDARRRS